MAIRGLSIFEQYPDLIDERIIKVPYGHPTYPKARGLYCTKEHTCAKCLNTIYPGMGVAIFREGGIAHVECDSY